MPDTKLSQAIKEAYASSPSDDVIYHTIEIWHSAFTEAIRVVRSLEDISARLEISAARDHGTLVDFVAFAFDLVPPDVQTTALPQCVLEIDNVSRAVLAEIDKAILSTEPITIIYRAFLASNLTVGPENDPPLELQVQSITADVFKIRAVCGFNDLTNKRFPGLEYTSEVFPGLIAQ